MSETKQEKKKEANKKYYLSNEKRIREKKKNIYINETRRRNETFYIISKVRSGIEDEIIIEGFMARKTKYPRLLNQDDVIEIINREKQLMMNKENK